MSSGAMSIAEDSILSAPFPDDYPELQARALVTLKARDALDVAEMLGLGGAL